MPAQDYIGHLISRLTNRQMSGKENSTHGMPNRLCLAFPKHHYRVRKVLRTPFISLPFISNKSGLLFALFRVEFGNFCGEERELFWGKGSCAMCIREGAKKFSRQMMSPSASLSAQTLCVSVLFSPFPFFGLFPASLTLNFFGLFFRDCKRP